MKTKFSLLLASMLVLTGCSEGATVTSSTEQTSHGSATSSTSAKPKEFTLTFDENENIKAYKSEAEKSVEFIKKNVTYKVGDDNAFALNPEATVTDLAEFNETKYDEGYDITLERLIGGNFAELDKTNLAKYAVIDSTNATIDFTDAAIGETFKITYIPSAIPPKQTNITAKDLVVEVRDGYNVTDVNELAYISNDNQDIPHVNAPGASKNSKEEWDAFKTAHGLKLGYAPKGMFIHANLKVTSKNFPAAYLINDYEVEDPKYTGKLNDEVEIYQRVLEDNEKFELRGNYFTIDASAIPVVALSGNDVNSTDQYQISHSQLFFFIGKTSEALKANEKAPEVVLSDLRLLGNTPKSEDKTASGGLIMAKPRNIKYTVDNCRTLKWFITYYGEKNRSPILFDSCYGTDAFNTFVYLFGCPNVTIKDSKLIGAGGPCIIQDHVNIKKPKPEEELDYITNTKVINSKLESYVQGNEGWFEIMGAKALVPQVRVFDSTLRATFKTTFLFEDAKADAGNNGKTFFNLIAINKDGGAEAPVENPDIRGSIKFDNEYAFDYTNSENTVFDKAYQGVLAQPQLPPVLRTNATEKVTLPVGPQQVAELDRPGIAVLNPTGGPGQLDGEDIDYSSFAAINLFGGPANVENPWGTMAPYAVPTTGTPMNQGDKLAVYYGGMMFLFEYCTDLDNAEFNK